MATTTKDGEHLKAPELTEWRNGTLTGAYYYQSKIGKKRSEVKLVGHWEGEGHGYWFAPWKAVVALAAAGLIRQRAGDPERFEVTADQRLGIYRVKVKDSKAHDWKAFALQQNGDAVAPALEPFEVRDPRPADGNGDAAATAPSAPAAPSAPQAEPEPDPPAEQETRRPTTEERAARDREHMAEVAELYAAALAIAADAQVRTFRRGTNEINAEALQAGAATVLISLREDGVRAHPGQARALREVLHELEDELAAE